jgi:alanyl aminopeptidase
VRKAFVGSGLEESFAAYVRRTLGPALQSIGLDKRADEPDAVTALRPSLMDWLGDEGRDPQVREHARAEARAWLANPSEGDASMAGVALQLAALDGDRALFEEYRKRFEAATIPADRTRYLQALGAFSDPGIVEEALRYSLAGPLRPQEMFSIPLRVAAQSPAQEERTYRWMTENYAAITSRVPPSVAATWLPHFAGGCSEERLAAAREFFADAARSLPGTETELQKVGEGVKSCVELREREGRAVGAYLQSSTRGE